MIQRQAQVEHRIAIAHAVQIVIECCRSLPALDRELPDVGPLDLSPENIQISTRGEVWIVGSEPAELPRLVPGHVASFSYLSPETASGRPYDRRTDVFSLGIVLWELLSGARLFVGATDYETVELVRAARVPTIASRNREVDAELEAIVLRALAKEPRNRHASTATLGDALAGYLSNRGLQVSQHDIASLPDAAIRR